MERVCIIMCTSHVTKLYDSKYMTMACNVLLKVGGWAERLFNFADPPSIIWLQL